MKVSLKTAKNISYMQPIKDKIKRIIGFFPSKIEKYIYNYYWYIRSFPKLSVLYVKLITLPSITKEIEKEDSFIKKKNTAKNQVKKEKQNLVFKDIEKAQPQINSLFHSSTYQYKIDKLKAIGDLKKRQDIFNQIAPNFFQGWNFLNIGCNTGYFPLVAAQFFEKVQIIDEDEKFIKLCKTLKQSNMEVFHDSFRDFMPLIEFDKIFIDNVHHHIFKQCRGWEWICKLAAISNGEVLIEGPVDTDYKDIKTLFSKELQSKFTFEDFMQAMDPFFSLEKKIKSINPDCWVMLFKRKLNRINNQAQLDNLPITKILKNGIHSLVYLTRFSGKKIVAKIIPPRFALNDYKIRIQIASFSPLSNGITGFIYKNNKFVGWFEEYENKRVNRSKENQVELLKLICDHVVFLAKLGYFDTDCSTRNFFIESNKFFDKGGVAHIKILDWNIDGTSNLSKFFKNLNDGFNIIDKEMLEIIYNALNSKDLYLIEQAFISIKNRL